MIEERIAQLDHITCPTCRVKVQPRTSFIASYGCPMCHEVIILTEMGHVSFGFRDALYGYKLAGFIEKEESKVDRYLLRDKSARISICMSISSGKLIKLPKETIISKINAYLLL